MSCTIELDETFWDDDDVFEAAQIFALNCGKELPNERFELKICAEDSMGWVAYLYGHSKYGEEIVGMIGRSCYHWEDTYFLSEEDMEKLQAIVIQFAESISPDGTTYAL